MVNSINKRKEFITPEKAASFIPIFISSGISILLIIFFVLPQYIKSNKVNLELNELIKKKNDLDNLKSKYKKTNQKFEKLIKEKQKIIELISGTSNLDTLLAKFGDIGKKNKIEFLSIVPKKIVGFIPVNSSTNANNNNQNSNITIDPLLVEGTKKYIIDFTFKADFLNLLNQNSNNGEINNPTEKIEVKLSTTFYGRP